MNDRQRSKPLLLPLDRRRILLVEDDSRLLSMLSAFLFRAGAWDVWQAHGAGRARELWKTHSADIDVVIVDVHLQDGNGLDLLDELCAHKVQLFCLAISGSPVVGKYASQLLLKPFTEQMLISRLLKV